MKKEVVTYDVETINDILKVLDNVEVKGFKQINAISAIFKALHDSGTVSEQEIPEDNENDCTEEPDTSPEDNENECTEEE